MINETEGRLLEDAVRLAGSIAIAGHIRPDGDCVGACLGLYNYLQENYNRSFDKEITVYMKDIPEAFRFLKNSGKPVWEFSQKKQYDLFIVLDCSSEDRLGDAFIYFKDAKQTLCFDHHISNSKGFAGHTILHADYSSTSEVLFTCMDEEKISKSVAEALYLGIVHDTGVFKHSCTSEQTMCIAGRLLSMGADSTKVIDGTFYEKSYIENQILGRCLMESMLVLDGRVILSYLSYKTMRLYGVVPANLSGIIDQLRVTKGTEVAVFIYETQPQCLKVSLRSNGKVDVSKTAVFFGGGGHQKAAGYEVHGFMHDAINNLLAGIAHQLDGH
ncbi:MAG: bifunctional oligoribonuclease/PAP phosphatase NrnA [Lachnospiraceae bacterium]|nr:bifunctional oligoribonuclease/PAP phosphatase NrnA [Lachnospiraceae bacterium]